MSTSSQPVISHKRLDYDPAEAAGMPLFDPHYDGDLYEEMPVRFCYQHEQPYHVGYGCPVCRLESERRCRRVFAEAQILKRMSLLAVLLAGIGLVALVLAR